MKQRFLSRQWRVLRSAKRDENWKMTVIYGIGLAGAVALMKAFCHIRRCCKQLGHGLLSGILDLTPRCTLLPNMNETLNYTDSRPRARSTGHAFGFESNLGIPVIISGMLSVFLSVFLLTMLLNEDHGMPLFAKFLLALLPTALTIAYIMGLRSRRPPRFDLDLLASWVNGRSLQPARIQPRHPFIPHR